MDTIEGIKVGNATITSVVQDGLLAEGEVGSETDLIGDACEIALGLAEAKVGASGHGIGWTQQQVSSA